jgi:2-oxoglutarate ferredoxin oxidoreductase subunit beta
LGIFYKHFGKETFEEGIKAYEVDKTPIIERIPDRQRLAQLINAKR